MVTIIGYAYDAALHCPTCAFNAAAVGLLTRKPPLSLRTDEHGLAEDLIDREGNPVHPMVSTDECACDATCDDCGALLVDGPGFDPAYEAGYAYASGYHD